ncbi:MAG: radical SAM protein [Pseudomonadota bacterium]
MGRFMSEYIKAFISLILKHKKILNQPIAVNVDTSNVCNLSCKMCYRNQSYFKQSEKQFLSIKTLEKLYSQIKPKMMLFGGISAEPLMNKDICELVRIASENKSKSFITTNGLLLDERTAYNLIKNGINLIKFSMDAATKETYEKIRKNNGFDQLLGNIRRLDRIRKELDVKREICRLDFVIQKNNLDDIIPFVYLAKELNSSFVSFVPVNFSQFTEETAREFRENYDLEKIIATLRKAEKLSSKIGLKSSLPSLLNGVNKMEKDSIKGYRLKDSDYYLPWFKYTRGRRFLCMSPWLQLAVYINGDVSICCTAFSHKIEKGLVLGNINEDNLSDIWNSRKLQKIRGLFVTGENYNTFDICRQCMQKLNIGYEIKMNNLF